MNVQLSGGIGAVEHIVPFDELGMEEDDKPSEEEVDYAIREAMTVAIAKTMRMEEPLSDYDLSFAAEGSDPADKTEQLGSIARSRTENACLLSSNHASNAINESYPYYFDRNFLLVTNYPSKSYPNENYSFKEGDFEGSHSLFVLRDTNGGWYAGSPANYVPGKEVAEKRLTGYYSGSSLSEVLEQVSSDEGGYWNISEEEIEATYTAPTERESPQVGDYLKTKYIIKDPKKTTYMYDGGLAKPTFDISETIQ
jgi:hypothetical protein